jgi:hypothetical protein
MFFHHPMAIGDTAGRAGDDLSRLNLQSFDPRTGLQWKTYMVPMNPVILASRPGPA